MLLGKRQLELLDFRPRLQLERRLSADLESRLKSQLHGQLGKKQCEDQELRQTWLQNQQLDDPDFRPNFNQIIGEDTIAIDSSFLNIIIYKLITRNQIDYKQHTF